MADLIIKENELKHLDQLLGDVPMKFGMPLVQFINQVVQLRAQEAKNQSISDAKSPEKSPTLTAKDNVEAEQN